MDVSGIVDTLIFRAERSIKKNENDYMKNGLLYCAICNEPKQANISFNGETKTVMCLCKCGKTAQEQARAAYEARQKQERIQRFRANGFPDAEMQNCTFSKDDNQNAIVSGICQRYVEHFSEMMAKGKGLLLFGTVGTGKTFYAACIANALIDDGYACLVTNFARLTNKLSGMYDGKQEYLDSLNNYSLLVIDDLAAERDTEYMNEIVFNLIDSRYGSGLPLIVTTNLTADELKRPANIEKQRVYSRLFEMCYPVEVKGSDRRKRKMIDEHDELKLLLEG